MNGEIHPNKILAIKQLMPEILSVLAACSVIKEYRPRVGRDEFETITSAAMADGQYSLIESFRAAIDSKQEEYEMVKN